MHISLTILELGRVQDSIKQMFKPDPDYPVDLQVVIGPILNNCDHMSIKNAVQEGGQTLHVFTHENKDFKDKEFNVRMGYAVFRRKDGRDEVVRKGLMDRAVRTRVDLAELIRGQKLKSKRIAYKFLKTSVVKQYFYLALDKIKIKLK